MDERKKCNDLSGKEWLQNSFSIWRGIQKTAEEKALKHPASYPIALCEKLIRTFSKQGCRVLDPFNGIGSTMIAARNLGCEGIGIDLSTDLLDFGDGKIIKKMKIAIWNMKTNMPEMNSMFPKI